MSPSRKVLKTTEAGAGWVLRLSKVVVMGVLSLMVCAPSDLFGADSAPQVACLNSKTGTIVNRARCQGEERRFSSADYTDKIDTVSKKVSTLRRSVSKLKTSLEAVARPARVVHVATSGTEYQTVESALRAATKLAPTASKPVLVKVAPGTYNLSLAGVTVPSHVSLEGSGVGVTRLTVRGTNGISLSNLSRVSQLTLRTSGASPLSLVTCDVAGGASFLDDIAIEVDSSGSFAMGLLVVDGILYANRVRVDIEDSNSPEGFVAISAGGLGARFEGTQIAITLKSSTAPSVRGLEVAGGAGATLRDSTIRVFTSGAGGMALPLRVGQTSQEVRFQNVRALTEWSASNAVLYVSAASGVVVENSSFESDVTVGSFGNGVVILDEGGEIQIRNSTVITPAGYTGISAYGAGSSIKVMGTFLGGGAGASSGDGVVTCSAVTDGSYVFHASSCS